MRAAAREAVIISEPIRNLSAHPSLVGRVAGFLSNPGVGEYRDRFDLAELRALARAHGAAEFLHHHGDRNALLIFRRASTGSAVAV
jgi:hypothetical protein